MEITKPRREDYPEIVGFVNEADKKFLDIYNKKEAEIMDIGSETAEGLIEGEKSREYICLKDNDKIVSFASFRLKNPQTVWVSLLYTRLDCQGKGYGATLTREIERIAKKRGAKVVVLETEPKAKWAANFYFKNGYKILSENNLKKSPFNKALDKPSAPNRHILGKVI